MHFSENWAKSTQTSKVLPELLMICSSTVLQMMTMTENLTNFLNRTREHGLKIGLEKIQYKKTSVEFCGSQFTTQGHKPTDKKIQDITANAQTKIH